MPQAQQMAFFKVWSFGPNGLRLCPRNVPERERERERERETRRERERETRRETSTQEGMCPVCTQQVLKVQIGDNFLGHNVSTCVFALFHTQTLWPFV